MKIIAVQMQSHESAMDTGFLFKNGISVKSRMRQKSKNLLWLFFLFFTLTGSIFSQTAPPKGAKLKTFTYNKASYISVGYVYMYKDRYSGRKEERFVENQNLLFLNKNSKDTIIYGRYFRENGSDYIDGTAFLYGYLDNKATTAGKPDSFYKGIFLISKLSTDVMFAEEITISPEDIDLFWKVKGNGDNVYKNEKEKQKDGTYFSKIEYPNRNSGIATIESYVTKFNQDINSSQVKLTFINGDVFEGTTNSSVINEVYPRDGVYKFATGEVYKGRYNERKTFTPHLGDGEIVFTDGATGKGNWLAQYNLGIYEIDTIYSRAKSPTEVRDMCKNAYEENQRKWQEEKIAKERQKQQEQAKRKKELTAKFGAVTAEKILAGKLEIGMSRAACKEVLDHTDDYFYTYRIIERSSSTETWEVKATSVLGFLTGTSSSNMFFFVNDKLARIVKL